MPRPVASPGYEGRPPCAAAHKVGDCPILKPDPENNRESITALMAVKPAKRRPAAEQDNMLLKALREAQAPVSAYDLIEMLRPQTVLAPQTVYRSLERLIDNGRAHRIESLNAYVSCRHPDHHEATAFAICQTCRKVIEFDEARVSSHLKAWAAENAFDITQVTLELRGTCADCRQQRSS
jgi:Fur family zinc uptake transcriptional regulator